MSMKKSLLAGVLIGSVVTLSGVTASEVGGPELLRACYVPSTGIIYRIGLPDTPEECRSSRHVEFSWTDGAGADHGSLSGLDQDDHPQYLTAGEVPSPWAGYKIQKARGGSLVRAGSQTILGVGIFCGGDKIVIGGGAFFESLALDLETRIAYDGPDDHEFGGPGWRTAVWVKNNGTEDQFPTYEFRAICVDRPGVAAQGASVVAGGLVEFMEGTSGSAY